MRRQPVRIVDGHFEGGYTDVFEFICPNCGDHPYLDYREVPPRLQWLRGPRTLEAAVAIYEKHVGSFPGTNGDSAGSLWPYTGPPAGDPLLAKYARNCRALSLTWDGAFGPSV